MDGLSTSHRRQAKAAYRLRGAYCAAKASVINLSMTFAVETSDYNIKVNALCPRGIAGVRLNTLREMFADYAATRGEARPPRPQAAAQTVDRTMQPEELAEFILFLVSPEGSRLNGQPSPWAEPLFIGATHELVRGQLLLR